jgi:hypothetical protein
MTLSHLSVHRCTDAASGLTAVFKDEDNNEEDNNESEKILFLFLFLFNNFEEGLTKLDEENE